MDIEKQTKKRRIESNKEIRPVDSIEASKKSMEELKAFIMSYDGVSSFPDYANTLFTDEKDEFTPPAFFPLLFQLADQEHINQNLVINYLHINIHSLENYPTKFLINLLLAEVMGFLSPFHEIDPTLKEDLSTSHLLVYLLSQDSSTTEKVVIHFFQGFICY